MSTTEQTPWTREQLRAVRIAEREMQIVNGTVYAALADEWARAWPEVAAYQSRCASLVRTGRTSHAGAGLFAPPQASEGI